MSIERRIVTKLLESQRMDEMSAKAVSDYLYNKSKFIVYLKEDCPNLIASDLATNGKNFDIHNSKDVSKTIGVIIEKSGNFKITKYYQGANKDESINFETLKKELNILNNLK